MTVQPLCKRQYWSTLSLIFCAHGLMKVVLCESVRFCFKIKLTIFSFVVSHIFVSLVLKCIDMSLMHPLKVKMPLHYSVSMQEIHNLTLQEFLCSYGITIIFLIHLTSNCNFSSVCFKLLLIYIWVFSSIFPDTWLVRLFYPITLIFLLCICICYSPQHRITVLNEE